MKSEMEQLMNYLKRKGISWEPTEEWSLIFVGNHPEGMYIAADQAPFDYINRLSGLAWSYRGHYTAVYVYPKEKTGQTAGLNISSTHY